eukprot:scaffold144578_cov30-Tisochrysis_lutea.AAC.2
MPHAPFLSSQPRLYFAAASSFFRLARVATQAFRVKATTLKASESNAHGDFGLLPRHRAKGALGLVPGALWKCQLAWSSLWRPAHFSVSHGPIATIRTGGQRPLLLKNCLTCPGLLGKLLALLLAHGLQTKHPIGHWAPRCLHHVRDRTELFHVFLREECHCPSHHARSPGPSYTVNVRYGRLGKIEVDYELHTLKVHSSRHELSGNEDPHFAQSKLVDDVIALSLRAVSVDDVDADAVEDELVKELHRALLRLDEYQDGRLDALLYHLAQREDLAVLTSHEEQRLFNGLRSRILLAYHHAHRLAQHRVCELLDGWHHGRREEGARDGLVGACAKQRVHLL